MGVRVYLVEDEAVARSFIGRVIERAVDLELVGSAADGTTAIEEINRLRPDLVLLDVWLPDIDGPGVLERLTVAPIVLMVTATADPAVVHDCLRLGAKGYILKGGEGWQQALPDRVREAWNRYGLA